MPAEKGTYRAYLDNSGNLLPFTIVPLAEPTSIPTTVPPTVTPSPTPSPTPAIRPRIYFPSVMKDSVGGNYFLLKCFASL